MKENINKKMKWYCKCGRRNKQDGTYLLLNSRILLRQSIGCKSNILPQTLESYKKDFKLLFFYLVCNKKYIN